MDSKLDRDWRKLKIGDSELKMLLLYAKLYAQFFFRPARHPCSGAWTCLLVPTMRPIAFSPLRVSHKEALLTIPKFYATQHVNDVHFYGAFNAHRSSINN
jgi:hypothetical protein